MSQRNGPGERQSTQKDKKKKKKSELESRNKGIGVPLSRCRLGDCRVKRRLREALAGTDRGAGASRQGRGGVHTGAGLRSQRSQVLAEKLYSTRSPRALLRSWPVKGGWSQVLATGCQASSPRTHTPFAHLQTQPTALVGTGRHRLPRHGQGRQGPRHSHCATSQPPGSPTGAGHRHVPESQAHSGTVPGAMGKETQRQGIEREAGRQGREPESE